MLHFSPVLQLAFKLLQIILGSYLLILVLRTCVKQLPGFPSIGIYNWPINLITTETEETNLCRLLCSLMLWTIISSSLCLQNAMVNVAQMLCRCGKPRNHTIPAQSVFQAPVCFILALFVSVCVDLGLSHRKGVLSVRVGIRQHCYTYLNVLLGPLHGLSVNILEQNDTFFKKKGWPLHSTVIKGGQGRRRKSLNR